MKLVIVIVVGFYMLLVSIPASAMQEGRDLHRECLRTNAYSNGYCEGFIIGVLSAHMSPWVINLQKGRTYFCIPGNLTFQQIAKAVQQYLADNPKKLRHRADINIWTAATEAFPCSQQQSSK